MFAKILKPVRFLVTGGISALVTIIFLYVFREVFGFWYLFAFVVAYILSVILNFSLQKWWVYKTFSTKKISSEFIQFITITSINFVINTILLYTFVSVCKYNYLYSQIGIVTALSVFNFYIYGYIFHLKNDS